MKQIKFSILLVMTASLLLSCAAPVGVTPTETAVPSATPAKPTVTATSLPPALTPTATAEPEPEGLKPGDAVGDLVLKTAPDESAIEALLWDYCDPTVGTEQGEPAFKECEVPQFPYLFIGNGMGGSSPMSAEELDAIWQEIKWQLFIDTAPVDLEAFGTIDVWNNSIRLWNIAIEIPATGEHTLRYVISPEETPLMSYETTWAVTIKDLAEFPELSLVLPEQPTPLPEPEQLVKLGSGELPWWNEHVFYEVFVRSFKDSDGDGIGDLQGLISMLDYLNDGDPHTDADLGVTGLWLMPVAQSPSYHGYDVTDYLTIEEDYGTNEDFQQLMAEAHARGMVIIVDLVMNHTSSEHPWFIDSQKPDSPYRTWYIWDESPIPYPSPWGSQVWHALGDSYYYGLFWSGMPDLNYNNGEVTLAMREIIQFWLEEMGVDGFRLDAVRHLIENGAVQANTPATHAWLEDFYRYVHTLSPDALTVGEVWDTTAAVVEYVGDEVDIAFEFDLAGAILNAVKNGDNQELIRVQETILESYGQGQYAAFLTNHDQNRVINQLQRNRERARVAATLLLTNPGVPFIYYGEEIGMRGVKPDEDIRRPMQWDTSPAGGFTSGTPWRALNNDIATVNVQAQAAAPDSLLNHYRQLIHLRMDYPALQVGDLWLVQSSSNQVYALLRHLEGEAVLVVVNLGSEAVSGYTLRLDEGPLGEVTAAELLLGEGEVTVPVVNPSGGFEPYQPLAELAPYESVLIRLSP